MNYTAEQTKTVLESCGMQVQSETASDWLVLCPFHPNTDTPAMTVGKTNGLFFCHNGDCGESGTLETLVMERTGTGLYPARRLIAQRGAETYSLDSLLDYTKEQDLPVVPRMYIDSCIEQFWRSDDAQDYMAERGFTKETIRKFEVGYEDRMIVVPVLSEDGCQFVGTNKRSIDSKWFMLSEGFPKRKVLYNLNQAKRSHSAIVCESQFDVMMLDQVGYPNAVCPMGSSVSAEQVKLLRTYFDTVVIMTDNDKAGRTMGYNLVAQLRGVTVKWAYYGNGVVYPDGAKDVCDMSPGQIRRCVENAVSNLYYTSLT